MQIMPETAVWIGARNNIPVETPRDLLDRAAISTGYAVLGVPLGAVFYRSGSPRRL